MIWRKPSYCNGATACPEVQHLEDGRVQLRNSEQPDIVLTFTPPEWSAFTLGVVDGQFDAFL